MMCPKTHSMFSTHHNVNGYVINEDTFLFYFFCFTFYISNQGTALYLHILTIDNSRPLCPDHQTKTDITTKYPAQAVHKIQTVRDAHKYNLMFNCCEVPFLKG